MYSELNQIVFNRRQRKKINAVFKPIFRDTQRSISDLKEEAEYGEDKEGKELAKKMVEAFNQIKAVINPTIEQKFAFLRVVAPSWESAHDRDS